MNRRKFLKVSSAIAAGVALPMSVTRAFAGASPVAIPDVTLNNGVKMPRLGFGTLYLKDDAGVDSIADAINLGYRLLDTATIYGNEEFVGRGIKKSGIDRKKLFVTSKLWVDDSGYESTKQAFNISLKKLQTDYLDLYLIHRPRGKVKESWQAMEELHQQGKIRAIGVSNFSPAQLEELMSYARVKPVINQVETHAYFQEMESYQSLQKQGIQMEAWSPFAQGRNNMFSDEALAAIGKKYNKTNAQVCLRWHFQRGVVAIPRSSQHAHRAENLDIFDFELSDSDMQAITKLDLNTTQFPEWS
ncbi:aldo/keto reductase [Neptunicella marina]|uniref:Aldo/keto reductase n=1 Tax=Neptunicella marina TaxID=2125989 RepID=A0A8J6LY64_9ALTE|nr:aldo/keto reductase [Neptunicella marina]MBC3765200.1 aldo/keto reductase [Neptunicella marina]